MTPEEQAKRYMESLERRYQEENPCPNCGSHNVHIGINALGNGYVDGTEWCEDCKWCKRTNTFPALTNDERDTLYDCIKRHAKALTRLSK